MTTTESPPSTQRQSPRTARRAIRRRSLRRVPDVVRSQGVRSLVAKLVGHLVYRNVAVMATDLTRPLPEVSCDVDLIVEELEEKDIDAYVAFGPLVDAETVRRRLAAGSRCFVAWHDGRIVNGGWCDFGNARFDAINAVVPIGPKDTYGRDAYTVPELRGRNIATMRMSSAMKLLKAEGYERGLGYVLPQNRRAFGPPTKSGVTRIGSLGWFGIGPLRVYFFKRDGARRRYFPRFLRNGCPARLELDLS
jgi:hypothetical protein